MAFSCNTVLNDIDINCQKIVGGLKKILVCRQQDIDITVDPVDDCTILSVYVENEINIQFLKKDGVTVFSETKTDTNGLPLFTTSITVQLPNISSALNHLDQFAVGGDLVVIALHNNGTVTITGVVDGMWVTYEADSGTTIGDKSYINVTFNAESGVSSAVADDISVFTNPEIFN
jgi:hypothetical protein